VLGVPIALCRRFPLLVGGQQRGVTSTIPTRDFASPLSISRSSTLSRTGVSARTSAGVYATAEPTRDHLGLPLLPGPPTLLRTPPRLLSNGGGTDRSTTHSRRSPCSGHRMQGRPLLRSLSDGPVLELCI
jgi:hypothetical protein